jgi:diguanylate cyclase (GGDEF)-like protein/PAS domain S-box-containing protein
MTTATTTILVVDDDLTAITLMRAALQKAGFAVSTAVDGTDGLRQFRDKPSDMVMLDVDMPGLSGYEVCAALRREAGPLLPIVMVTGFDDVRSVDAAYIAGATDFIAKPINWTLLGYRVRYLLRGYQAVLDLRTAEARNTALLAALPDLLFELDIEGRYVQYHPPRSELLPTAVENFIGKTIEEVLSPEAARVCRAAIQEAYETGVSIGKQLELRLPGGIAWVELSVSRPVDSAQTPHFIVLARDVTERRAAADQIRRLAYYDQLTGLPNREHFRSRVASELDNARTNKHQLALLCVDLDKFKRINDTLGHSVGDDLLRMTALRLREAVRCGDPMERTMPGGTSEGDLSRLGGDEFMFLLTGIDAAGQARIVATRILSAIMRPILLARHEVMVTPSIGIAVFPADGEDFETLFRNADLAMYFAKRQGPGTFSFYKPSMNANALKRLTMESKLAGAIAGNELSLRFQPQFDLGTGLIVGMEALLRWTNAELGQVPPLDFIPVAEETGMILPIGEWVLRAACTQAKAWHDEGLSALRIAVNVSGLQLAQRGFPGLVATVLRDTGLPPVTLELEITESVIMANEDWTRQVLGELKAIGVQISIDDFGTGYSSLGRLRDFPIDRLKIDGSFIRRVQNNGEDRVIAATIIAMAKTLKLEVVAEGVEDLAQLLFLQEERCTLAQGFFLSVPLTAAESGQLLRRFARDFDGTRTERLRRVVAEA